MTKLRDLKKLDSELQEVVKLQEYVGRCISAIISSQVLDGTLLQNVSLKSGLNEVAHKLGRKPQGWIIVRKRANANIWDEQDSNSKSKLTLRLQASAAVKVDLWVF
jgi:hypothetical protein